MILLKRGWGVQPETSAKDTSPKSETALLRVLHIFFYQCETSHEFKITFSFASNRILLCDVCSLIKRMLFYSIVCEIELCVRSVKIVHFDTSVQSGWFVRGWTRTLVQRSPTPPTYSFSLPKLLKFVHPSSLMDSCRTARTCLLRFKILQPHWTIRA